MKGVIYITKKNLIWDLKMGGGIGGEGEAVNGGAVLGGRLYLEHSILH